MNHYAKSSTLLYTLRNFGFLVLLELVACIILLTTGFWNPQVLHVLVSMLVNLIPSYFFAKYRKNPNGGGYHV